MKNNVTGSTLLKGRANHFHVDSTYKQIILSVIKSIKIGGKVLFPESELNDLIKKLKDGS